jgi:selenide,water dikinase
MLGRIGPPIAAGAGKGPLLVGHETGDDAAVYRLSDDTAVVVTADFITPVCDDPFLYGQVAAANALSDVFAMGGRPLVALALCAFPEALSPEDAAAICAGGEAKTAEAGAVVGGGHSARNPELLYGLAVTGLVHPGRVVRNVGARAGDVLVLTKPIGTGVIIGAHRAGKIGDDLLLAACRSMATLNATAGAAAVAQGARAATDVTGFGLAGHALGMARGSGVGLRVWIDRVPLLEGAAGLYEQGISSRGARLNRKALEKEVGPLRGGWRARDELLFDPQTSGGLLIAVAAEGTPALLDALARDGVQASAIGEVVPEGTGPRLELVGG